MKSQLTGVNCELPRRTKQLNKPFFLTYFTNIQSKTYISAGSSEDDLGQVFPMEYLNSLTPSGMPKNKLELKVGVPVLLLRNLNPAQGLCNGTRIIVTGLEAKIITGDQAGQSVFLVSTHIGITINKAQFVNNVLDFNTITKRETLCMHLNSFF